MDIHVFLHGDQGQLGKIETKLDQIIRRLTNMSAELDRVKAEVQENTQVVGSAVVLIEGLAQTIRDHVDDPAALAAVADELDATSNALAAAVAANTPAAPSPTPTPPTP